MELGDRLGFAGIFVGILGLGITILYPTKRWIGAVCIVIAFVFGGYWIWAEVQSRHQATPPEPHPTPTPTATETPSTSPLTDQEIAEVLRRLGYGAHPDTLESLTDEVLDERTIRTIKSLDYWSDRWSRQIVYEQQGIHDDRNHIGHPPTEQEEKALALKEAPRLKMANDLYKKDSQDDVKLAFSLRKEIFDHRLNAEQKIQGGNIEYDSGNQIFPKLFNSPDWNPGDLHRVEDDLRFFEEQLNANLAPKQQ